MAFTILSYLKEHKEIRIISLDVFDTLLFRAAYNPIDIFGKMYEFAPDLFPEDIISDDWICARQAAERTARKKKKIASGNFEVTLAAIYEELPTAFHQKERLMDLEIETEKTCCFLNTAFYEEIKKVAALASYEIVICSDMYLDSETIRSILQSNGLNCSLLKTCFVSCEWEASKRTEELFHYLLRECGAKPEEVLHIGDDYYRDVGVARYLGMHALHLNFISDAPYRYPFLKLEEILHGTVYKTPANELLALRLLAAEKGMALSELTEERRFWYDLGAMIYGPFLTYAMEWVLDQAEKKDITKIRPFMREGDFLSRMLCCAAKMRRTEYSVEPVYISRFAIFTSLFEQITEKEVEYLISTYNIYVKDVFRILRIKSENSPFEPFLQEQVNDLRRISMGEDSGYDAFLAYLSSPEMLYEIRRQNAGGSALMLEYLQRKGLMEECITLDLGWRGSMQKALEDIFKEHGISNRMEHLLCICNPTVATNAVDGCRIQGYMGGYGRYQTVFSQLSARLFELALLSTKGTTIGYKKEGDRSEPVTSEICYPQEQIEAMQYIQEGILAFQAVYLEMVKTKPHLKELGKKPEDLCSLIGRLHAFPLYREAEMLSTLVYDQNFGANTFTPVLPAGQKDAYRKKSFEEYYAAYRNTGIYWYSGLNALGKNRLFYAERHLQMTRKFTMLSVACLANQVLDRQDGAELVLVQAGDMTKALLLFLAMAGARSRIAGIVDNDPRAQGTYIGGVKIYVVGHVFKNPLYVFATIRAECYTAISSQL